MAVINLDVEQLKKINSEIGYLDNTLLNSYLPNMNNILTSIKANVLSDEVNSLLNTISLQIDNIGSSLKADLPKLEEFLTSQLSSYEMSVEEAEEEVRAVLAKMESFAGGVITLTSSQASATVSSETQTTSTEGSVSNFARANSIAGEHFGDNWDSYLSSFSNYYANTRNSHGLVTAVGNAVLDTVGAAVGTVWNTATFALNEAVTGVQWVGDVLFGDSVVGNLIDWII